MKKRFRNVPEGNQPGSLKLVSYRCPSCNMMTWHNEEFASATCPFCSDRSPTYLIKVAPEKMAMGRVIESPRDEEPFRVTPRRSELVAQENGASPFDHEFFMVQGAGFLCMAYRNGEGKWRGAFDHEELPGAIRVLG